MAKSENTGEVLATWLSPAFAQQVRELADHDRRTVSNFIKLALEDRLSAASLEKDFAITSIRAADADSAPATGQPSHQSRGGAGLEEE